MEAANATKVAKLDVLTLKIQILLIAQRTVIPRSEHRLGLLLVLMRRRWKVAVGAGLVFALDQLLVGEYR